MITHIEHYIHILREMPYCDASFDSAIEFLRQGFVASLPMDPFRYKYSSDLARALHHRVQISGSIRDLDELISLHESSTNSAKNPSDRSRAFCLLGYALKDRFEMEGRDSDSERCENAFEKALEETPFENTTKALILTGLGAALLRGLPIRDPIPKSTLDRAIHLVEQGIACALPDDPNRIKYQTWLCNALLKRFQPTANVEILERAITLSENFLNLTPQHDEELPDMYALRCSALHLRYRVNNDMSDLNEAILLAEKSVSAAGPFKHVQAERLHTLSRALIDRIIETHSIADSHRAVEVLETAITALPIG